MSEENEWIDIQHQHPDRLGVDLMLKDGSTIIKAWPQSDGDFFYWKGAGCGIFIASHHVKSWRPHRSEE